MGSLRKIDNDKYSFPDSFPIYEINLWGKNTFPSNEHYKKCSSIVVVCVSVTHTTTYIFFPQKTITYRGKE
jgi:hypothetical protein